MRGALLGGRLEIGGLGRVVRIVLVAGGGFAGE